MKKVQPLEKYSVIKEGLVGYNFSVESAVLLAAGYLDYMVDVGSREFNVGTMTDEEVEDLFQ